MDSKLGKWIKRIVVILIVLGLVAFGVVKLIQNKTSNVEKSALETLEALDSYYMEASMDFYKGEDTRSLLFVCNYAFFCSSSTRIRPMITPITDAIISPLVQPLESPRQCRPSTLVFSFSSILTRLL